MGGGQTETIHRHLGELPLRHILLRTERPIWIAFGHAGCLIRRDLVGLRPLHVRDIGPAVRRKCRNGREKNKQQHTKYSNRELPPPPQPHPALGRHGRSFLTHALNRVLT